MTKEQLQKGQELQLEINYTSNNLQHIDDAIISFKSGRKERREYFESNNLKSIKYNDLTIYVEDEQLNDILLTLKAQWEEKLINLQEEFKAI